jgi:single-stranded-DNA-specific exonuclease
MKEDGSTAVGSARSVKGINIYELLKECSSRLLKFGGHELAAGLSLSMNELEPFTREIEEIAERKYFIKDSIHVDVDCELGFEEVNEELYSRLETAGPYGEGFEAPAFLTRNLSVLSDRKTAKNYHIMVLAGENDTRVSAVKWSGEDENLQGRVFDAVYSLGMNTYRNNSQLQLTVSYLLEASGDACNTFKGQLVDGRREDIYDLLGKYGKAAVFYEGLESRCPVAETINRYEGAGAENLIFLSIPVNSYVFREITALTNPGKLIVNFSLLPDYSFRGFLSDLLGIIKHVTASMDGCTSLEFLAARLCVEENLIVAALKYLRALGRLDYSINPDDRKLYLSRAQREPERTVHTLEKSLRNALMEKNAYKEFILKLNIEQFREYLK